MTKMCFLCGEGGADTTEHVVPKCLYPGSLPSDVITLPAHAACRATAKDEEAFRNHIAAAIPPTSPGYRLWEATWKAIHRPQARGMMTAFYRDMLSLPTVDEAGVLRPSPVVARLRNERADRVLAKIVKGLFAWKTGDILRNDTVLWRFGQAERGRELLRLPDVFRVHDVLDVAWGQADDAPDVTMWILGFHGVCWFWVTTMPRDRPLPGVQRPAVPMAWP